ncbi:DNA repair protein XRCC1 isoform X2 [Dermatophagoides farinae]|uniref:DNA repair protein XRCC1 isoform X2 n=1 Tax=Dermatophagoides farinae TaxID=6954 RepID=UPI003F639FE6
MITTIHHHHHGNVLLPVFSSQLPSNCRKQSFNNQNERFKFTTKQFMSTSRSLPCKFIKCVCSQPYNKNICYGIASIKIYGQQFQEHKNSDSADAVHDVDDDDDDGKKKPLWMKKFKFFDNKLTMVDDEYFAMNFDHSKLKQQHQKQQQQSNSNVTTIDSNKQNIDSKMSSLSKLSAEIKPNLKTLPLNDDDGNNKNVNVIEQLSKPSTSTSSTKAGKKRNHNDDDVQQQQSSIKIKPTKKIKKPFEKLFDNVVFVLSGYQNPIRMELKQKALAMGAHYKPEWNSNCTHLICAFENTPKYRQVNHLGGKIVREQWINDSYDQRKRLSWRNYLLGKFIGNDDDNDSDDVDDKDFNGRNNKATHNNNTNSININRTKNRKDDGQNFTDEQRPYINNKQTAATSMKMVMETNKKNIVANADYDSDIIYDLETEDDDDDDGEE